jgi:lactoylglutathione lyase
MRRQAFGILAIAALFSTVSPAVSGRKQNEEVDHMKEQKQLPVIWCVQINVLDIDRAIAFYTELLGFEVSCREYYPEVVSLGHDGAHILLHHATEKTDWDYEDESYVNLNLQVSDLKQTVSRLSDLGVRPLDPEPLQSAIGPYIRILDPSGNMLHIIQITAWDNHPEKMEVFNVGIHVSDMKKSRIFYGGLLGFPVFSEDYYPPVVPFRSEGVSFVLHERKCSKSPASYPRGTQILLTMVADDLDDMLKNLLRENVKPVPPEPGMSPVGLFTALRDPDGNIIELLKPQPNAFDSAAQKTSKSSR